MRIQRFSPIRLGIFLAVGALLIKVYQHNRLVYLTHTHQQLSRRHAELVQECMQLRAQKQRVAGFKKIITTVTKKLHMQPLTLDAIVSLSVALAGGS